MNGILCVDKPAEHTSFDVVARMRGIARTRKIGHGGTLDPMATGVLPLFFGRATKAVDLLPLQDKHYRAAFRLGVVTDTQDITGTVLERHPVTVCREDVAAAVQSFLGKQTQTPPMYSAVQVNGQRLYDLARQGLEVERPGREVVFHSLNLLEQRDASDDYVLDAACSKGAYIRTLCHELGRLLGCGATLTALRRTEACGFSLECCVTLEEARLLAERDALRGALLPVESVFSALPGLELTPVLAGHFCNGVALSLNQFSASVTGRVAVYGPDRRFLGLAEPDAEQLRLRLVKLFCVD